MTFKNGADNPSFTNVRNKDARTTESKAFLRSMNATYSFPPFLLKYLSMIADKVYIYIYIYIYMVEYPFQNPAWASTTNNFIIIIIIIIFLGGEGGSSIHFVSLFRKTEV